MRVWPILKTLPVGLALMIGAASIGPEDAVSNLSKWSQLLGIQNVPAWLTSKAADHVIIVWSMASAAIYIICVWGIPWFWQRARTNKVGAPHGVPIMRSTFEARTGGKISAQDAQFPSVLAFTAGWPETGGSINLDDAKFIYATEDPTLPNTPKGLWLCFR
jgi:hypothetical protein